MRFSLYPVPSKPLRLFHHAVFFTDLTDHPAGIPGGKGACGHIMYHHAPGRVVPHFPVFFENSGFIELDQFPDRDGLKTALKQKDAVIKQTTSKMTELLEIIVEMMLENKDSIQSIIQKTGMSETEIRQIAADNGIPLEQ